MMNQVKEQIRALGIDVDEKESLKDWVVKMDKNSATRVDSEKQTSDHRRANDDYEAKNNTLSASISVAHRIRQLASKILTWVGLDPVEVYMWLATVTFIPIRIAADNSSTMPTRAKQPPVTAHLIGVSESAMTSAAKFKLNKVVNTVLDVHG